MVTGTRMTKPRLMRRKWNYSKKLKRQLYHIISKKKHAHGVAMMKRNEKRLKLWRQCVERAKAELGLKGFVLIKKGTALYSKAKGYYRVYKEQRRQAKAASPAGQRPARANRGKLPSRFNDFIVDRPRLVLEINPRR